VSRTTNRSLCAVLAVVIPLAATAQAGIGLGFDPTPVEIPTVPKATPRPVDSMDLLTLRDFHGSRISPDGKWVAFVLGQAVYKSNSYRSGLFVISTTKGSRPINLGTAGPPNWQLENQWLEEDPQWSADSRYVYYRMKNPDAWQVWRWDRESGARIRVTQFSQDVLSFQITSDGTKIFLSVAKPPPFGNQDLAEYGILYDGHFAAGAPRPLLEEVALDLTDPARGPGRGPENETWVYDLRDGLGRKATEEEIELYGPWRNTSVGKYFSEKELQDQAIYRAKVSPDGRAVAYARQLLNPAESAQIVNRLFVRSVGRSKSISLTPSAYDVEEFWWSSDSKEIFYGEYDGADSRPYKLIAVSATGRKAHRILDSTGFQYNYSLDRSGRFLSCTHETAVTPPELRLVDLSTGVARTLVSVNAEWQNVRLSPTQRIAVTGMHGDRFWGHLVLPLNY
jgi:dipeptidyl aminopeptidase/acylaminoacyl peptidase